MSQRLLTTLAVAVLLTGLTYAVPAHAEEAKTYTKAEIEQIVHDYIMNNAKVMMDSVDDYQRKLMEARSSEGLDKNADELFRSNSPFAGKADGDMTLVEFFDYNCHYCKTSFTTIQKLLETDKNLKVVFKEFPILSESSNTAAKWALAAHKQGKYYEFHKRLMENKKPIDSSFLEKVAKDVGMDVDQAKKDLDSKDISEELDKNQQLAENLGLTGTPAFILPTNIVRGAASFESLEAGIAAARAKAKK
jgi:protein-disulfide isomerase